jgi:U3 small nucleolar RNA-associated protein 14
MQTALNSELATKFKVPLTQYLLLPPTYPIFQPTSEPETAVNKLLKPAHLRDEFDIQRTKDLQLDHLSTEEAAARGAELCWIRELIFHAEAQAKWVAMTKSKPYRQLKKKRS